MRWRETAAFMLEMIALLLAGWVIWYTVLYGMCRTGKAADPPQPFSGVMVIAHCASQGCLPCEVLKSDQPAIHESFPGLYWAWAMDGRRPERVSQFGRTERAYRGEPVLARSYPTIVVYRAGRNRNDRWSEVCRIVGYDAGWREVLELAIRKAAT